MTLPPLPQKDDRAQTRAALLDTLQREVYGFTPPAPKAVHARVLLQEENAFAGKAVHSEVMLSFSTPKGTFSFPIAMSVPKAHKKPAVFLLLNFRADVPDRYYPTEEILDNGFACISLYYQDITSDDDDFACGLAGHYTTLPRGKTSWGKLGMWAFAASRVMDFLTTCDNIDCARVIVIGHSRLGKTALWCAAQDARFAMAVSNNSGCSGAAITRGKQGERISHITQRFPYWFCEQYAAWADREEEMPFDQHFLLAAIAPRPVCVGSAAGDTWADPQAEFLCCRAASPAWEAAGSPGLIFETDSPPTAPIVLHEGCIGYHLRAGSHFLSRTDWLAYMDFAKKALPRDLP